MKRRGRGDSGVRLESAPPRQQQQQQPKGGSGGSLPVRMSTINTPHRRLAALDHQLPSTEDCSASERSSNVKRSESNWHVSIQNKDWTLLQKYLEQLASPHPPPAMGDRSSNNHSQTQHHYYPNAANSINKTSSLTGKKKKKKSVGNWLKKRTLGSSRLGGSINSIKNHSIVSSGISQYENGSQYESQYESQEEGVDSNIHKNSINGNNNGPTTSATARYLDKDSLLAANAAGRTPLQLALNTPEIPDYMLHNLMRAQPRAVSRADARGRLPLHFAVVRQRRIETIQALVELYADALHHKDEKGKTPVAYALEVAKRHTHLSDAPKHFWALAQPSSPEAEWQKSQTKEWEMARWCLQTSAAQPPQQQQVHGHYAYEPEQQHPQSPEEILLQSNRENNSQPYLIQAMLHAAPPTVVMLLIGASSSLLQIQSTSSTEDYDSGSDDFAEENQHAVALGCSAFYLAIFRQYPLLILKLMGSLLSASQAVKRVRDETGLGLVSAHYVTKCFEKSKLLEYVAAEDFMVTMEQCIVEGQLPQNNSQFLEWWDKLKYLLLFCADKSPDDTPDDYLLHAAMENSDTPPNVIRLLLALYPGSARQPEAQSAHPLHLFAMHRDYIPRNYESPYMHGLNVMDMLLSLDESAVFHNFENRLPLHHAIAAGRMWSTIHHLISSYQSSLRIKDPITKLYPPLLAAAYRVETEDEEITRLLQLTRNQYSSIVWQGLSEKQQQNAVERIRQFESLKRLDTIFELLRRFPQSLEGAFPKTRRRSNQNRDIVVHPVNINPKKATPAKVERSESAGLEMIAFHYLSWCYKKVNNRWHPVENNMEILQTSIGVATEHGVMSKKSPDFVNWWGVLKLYFWHCYNTMPSPQNLEIPRDDEFLLHVAVSIPTTPPDIVELILGLFPQSASLTLPESRTYPLHLACGTTSYTPQHFEILKRQSTIELVLKAYPEAVFLRSDEGQMPLHVAIKSGKTLHELGPLIQQGPSLVGTKDPITGLSPFQLMAMSKSPSHDLRLRFQTIASNRHAEGWSHLTAQQKMREIRIVENEYQKKVFTSMFELLRLRPGAISQSNCTAEENKGLPAETDESFKFVDMEISDGKNVADDNVAPKRKVAPIRRHLSGVSRDMSTGSGGMSAFSTIDMMSAISNVSSHLSFRRRRTVSNLSDGKLSRSAMGGIGDGDDESEDSDIWSEDMSFHDDSNREIEKQRKSRAPSASPPMAKAPQTSIRQQKLKSKWQSPVDFIAEASSHSKSLNRRSVPTQVVQSVDSSDDVSFLDGINPRSKSVRSSSLRQALLGDSSSTHDDVALWAANNKVDDKSATGSSVSDSDESIQSFEEDTGRSSSSSESIQSVEEDPSRGSGGLHGACPVPGSASTEEMDSRAKQSASTKKALPSADIADDNGDDDDSIQDEIVQTDEKSLEKEEAAIVFRLRRSSCQRQGRGGPMRMKPGGKPMGGSQQNGSSVDMDFLTIVNASLPEGKMDFLSSLDVSATSLPPGPDSLPTGLDGPRTKVDHLTRIKEFPSEHGAGVKQENTTVLGPVDTSFSRSILFEDSGTTAQNESGLHMSPLRQRSLKGMDSSTRAMLSPKKGTAVASLRSPLSSPHTSRGSILQSPARRRSSLEISPLTCNYIGIKPQKLKSCLHCGSHSREVMMLPCNHLCLCRVCSDGVEIKSCPICFGPVTDQKVVS